MTLRPDSAQDEHDQMMQDRRIERIKREREQAPSPQEQQEQESMAEQVAKAYANLQSKGAPSK